MRLKDKQTGEIDEYLFSNKRGDVDSVGLNKGDDINDPIFFNSLAELCERFEDAPEEKKYGRRMPKNGDKYWYIFANGSIYESFWAGTKCDVDRFECGNAFWTEEEAERELARRKAYVILKEDTEGFKPDWGKDSLPKSMVFFDYQSGRLGVDQYSRFQDLPNDLIFATLKDAQASIKAHEKEWRVWLGVEE